LGWKSTAICLRNSELQQALVTGLKAIILGSAAGGGLPQWNCRCPVCALAWAGDARVKWRTQASVAVSADGERWTVINASPDLRQQIAVTPALYSKHELRSSPIDSVILTGAEIDQTAGLLTLRERTKLNLYATAPTQAAVDANPMFGALTYLQRRTVAHGDSIRLPGELQAELFAIPGKVPLYLEKPNSDAVKEVSGVVFSYGGSRLIIAPGAAAITPPI
jgi:pyrroloquinoline quinone biosynthesis protein B